MRLTHATTQTTYCSLTASHYPTMKALVYTAPKEMTLRNVPEPTLVDGEVVAQPGLGQYQPGPGISVGNRP